MSGGFVPADAADAEIVFDSQEVTCWDVTHTASPSRSRRRPGRLPQ
jgi:hypothetical protein